MKRSGLIVAMDVEVESIAANIQNIGHKVISGIPFSTGTLSGRQVVLARCGIGKVNAAICTQIMVSVFGVNEIINTGVAGAVAKGIRQNDIVIAERFVQHDVDTSAIGDPVGFVSTVNRIYFETDKSIILRLKAAIGSKARAHREPSLPETSSSPTKRRAGRFMKPSMHPPATWRAER